MSCFVSHVWSSGKLPSHAVARAPKQAPAKCQKAATTLEGARSLTLALFGTQWSWRQLRRGRRCFDESRPCLLTSQTEPEAIALAWKPENWSDGGKPKGKERISLQSSDFLTWARRAWPAKWSEEPRPYYRLGRASGMSLLLRKPSSSDLPGLVLSCASLVAGAPEEEACLHARREGISLQVLRSSKGLRHGTLSLISASLAGTRPEMALAKLRAMMEKLGHPIRGPGGGKAWNSQITIVGVRCLDLAASVAPPKRLQEMMDLDAFRLGRYRGDIKTPGQLFDSDGCGAMHFFGMRLKLHKDVFVPRAESRHLVEVVLELSLFLRPELRILDVTLGVGNALLPLLQRHPTAQGFGIDISSQAVALAKENAKLHNLDTRAVLEVGDLRNLELLSSSLGQRPFDVILANPPYVPDSSERLRGYREDLEQSTSESILASIAKLRRLLTPQGKLVLQLPTGETQLCAEVLCKFGAFSVEKSTRNTLTLAARKTHGEGFKGS
eukprot:s2343_g2.t1